MQIEDHVGHEQAEPKRDCTQSKKQASRLAFIGGLAFIESREGSLGVEFDARHLRLETLAQVGRQLGHFGAELVERASSPLERVRGLITLDEQIQLRRRRRSAAGPRTNPAITS